MSLRPFIALSAARNGLIGNMMKEMNMNTRESAPSAENQKSDYPDGVPFATEERDTRPIEWVPAGTTVAQAVDNLTHVVAKLLQTHMLIEKHLSDISKAIDRVVR